MQYDLPKDWDLLTHAERIAWHTERVTKEEPVFDMLEQEGVMSCFEAAEIRVRLAIVKSEVRRVQSALLLLEDQEFQGLWSALNMNVEDARKLIAERARILNMQMRRVGFKSYEGEDAQLASLKATVDRQLDEAESIEGSIIKLCDKHGVDPSPYLIVDAVKESK